MEKNQKESQSTKTPVDSTTEKTNSLSTKEGDKNGATKKDTATGQQNQGYGSNASNPRTTTPTAKKENELNREDEELEESTSWENPSNKKKDASFPSLDKK